MIKLSGKCLHIAHTHLDMPFRDIFPNYHLN